MSWLPVMTKKGKVEKEVALIKTNVKQIQGDAKKMGTALITLNNNVTLIDRTIENIKTADYTKVETFIDNLKLEDAYKADLKLELESSRDQALGTLDPIKEASEKIRGNMAVSMVKYQNMVVSLQAQKNVIESGAVQVETINKAMDLGSANTDVIKDLVGRAEKINSVTRQAVVDFDSANTELKSTLKGLGGNDALDIFNI